MKLNALLLDPAVLGDEGWAYLERVCGMLPDLGMVVCTGRSTVAQRVRGLRLGVDDWITKPCHPEEAMARIEAVSRRRRRGRSEVEAGPVVAGELEIRARPVPGLRRRRQPRPDPARVRAPAAAGRGQGPGAGARGHLPAGLGLRDGPRRPLGRRLHPQAAPEAGERSPGWGYIHTHFGVGYRFDPEPAGASSRSRLALPRAAAARAGSRARFTGRSQQLHGRITAARRPAKLGEHGDRNRAPPAAADGRLQIRPEEHAALVDGRPLSLT